MELVNVFENSKTEVELTNNLKKVFSIFCDIKEFKIFLYDEVLNSLKDFTKPWEILKKDYKANILNSYFCSFKYNTTDYIKEKDELVFPVYDD